MCDANNTESNIITRDCPNCFSYVPQGTINTCCKNKGCNYELVSTISASNPGLSCGASFQMLLEKTNGNLYECNQTTNTAIVSTINSVNSETIASQLEGQLLTYGARRYLPYQRLPPPFIPPSVIQLQMQTVNVGVPKPVNVCRPLPPNLSYNFMG